MSDEFGDDAGPDDMFDASNPAPDPEAVSIRFHEERVNRDLTDLGYWETLSEPEQEISRIIGGAVLTQLQEGKDPDDISDWLDDLREILGENIRRRDRRKDRDAITALAIALRNEGTL